MMSSEIVDRLTGYLKDIGAYCYRKSVSASSTGRLDRCGGSDDRKRLEIQSQITHILKERIVNGVHSTFKDNLRTWTALANGVS